MSQFSVRYGKDSSEGSRDFTGKRHELEIAMKSVLNSIWMVSQQVNDGLKRISRVAKELLSLLYKVEI